MARQREADRSARSGWILGLALAGGYLLVALVALPSYGPTWDCVAAAYPYGDRMVAYLRTGDEAFLEARSHVPAPEVRAPHPDFATWRFDEQQVRLPGSLVSGILCRLLWTELGWLPAMQAHNLAACLFVAVLVLGMARFAAPRLGPLAAGAGCVLLLCAPRFFAHGFNNLKDVPEASLYVLATVAGYRALTARSLRWWCAAGALTGLAMVQKANAVFIPVQLGLFALGLAWIGKAERAELAKSVARGLPLFALGFVVGYIAPFPPFWSAPIAAPRERFVEILRVGNTLTSVWGDVLPPASLWSADGWWMALWTTPPLLLALGALGAWKGRMEARVRWFLLLGVLVPVGRTGLPGMRNFDGVRHFLEFLPYLALLAGSGFAFALSRLHTPGPRALPRFLAAGASLAVFVPLAAQLVRTHPNGICYFGALAGGLDGAQARGLPDATDYWANSYWQGLAWIDEHASAGAALIVPVGGHVAQAALPVRTGGRVRMWDGERSSLPLFAMTITRREHYGPFLARLDAARTPAHEIRVQGAPILRVWELADDEEGRADAELWLAESAAKEARRRVIAALAAQPEVLKRVVVALAGFPTQGAEETERRLRELLPPELHDAARRIVWLLQASLALPADGGAAPPR
jgi:hypothetical protein